MANPKPDPEAAHRGREKGWATLRRRKEDKLAAELRERGWTCQPPEQRVTEAAADPALSLRAKGLYLMRAAGVPVDVASVHPKVKLSYAAGWNELVAAGYVEPPS